MSEPGLPGARSVAPQDPEPVKAPGLPEVEAWKRIVAEYQEVAANL